MAERVEMAHTSPLPVCPNLLRVLLRSRWDAASAAWIDSDLRTAADFDWDALLAVARQARVCPLLHLALHDRAWVPAHIRNAMRMDLFGVARQNLIALNALAAVLDALNDAGIPHILLKGAALALALYKNEGLRPMSDIDLLVPREDVPRALEVLLGCGYDTAIPEIHTGASQLYASELFLRANNPEAPALDLHWCLINTPHYHHKISAPALWENTTPVAVADVPSQTLAPEALLLHLAGHLALHHHDLEDADLLWSHDIALLIVENAVALDWDAVIALAQTWDLVIPLQRILPTMATEWRVPLPAHLMGAVAALQPSRAERRIVRWRASDRKRIGLWAVIQSVNALPLSQRLHYLQAQAFPSVRYMRENYGMRHPVLLPLYYGYRWLRGLGLVR